MYFKKVLSLGILFVLIAGVLSRDRAVSLDGQAQDREVIVMSTNKPVQSTENQTSDGSELTTMATSQTKFGLKLFQAIAKQNPEANTFISPFSVGVALSMLYNGAEGVSQKELSSLLEVMDLSLSEVNQGNKLLIETLENSDPQVQIAIANSLWSKSGFPIQQSFLDTNQQYYDAEIAELDFANPGSVDIINKWVAGNTQNKITKIIDSISPDRALFLINAIYFKGQWQNKFNPDNTQERDFYVTTNNAIKHPLMATMGKYKYYENEDLQVINLPYGSGRLGMNIFLPKENSSLNQFLAGLNSDKLTTWLQQMRMKDGNLQLPRFKQEYETSLNQTLQQLGVSSIFNASQADFAALSNESVAVDTIKHKAVIEVNEEGTEAAATTSIGITTTSISIPFNMIVNRPFFYTIQDNETGAIAFMGTVQNPSE